MVYLSDEISNHTSIWVCLKPKAAQWHKVCLLPHFQWMHCPALCVYRCWEKCHLHFGAAFEQWGRFHELYSVVSLTLGNRSVLVILGDDCKLWMMDDRCSSSPSKKKKKATGTMWMWATWWSRRCFRVSGLASGLCGGLCLHSLYSHFDKFYS